MLPLLLIIAAPALLVILSIFRINNFIAIPVGALTFFMMILGCVLSYVAMADILKDIGNQPARPRCGMPEAAILISGVFVALVIVPIIGLIGGFAYHLTHKTTNTAPSE